ncbi:MAG TPA: FKBP-type peptidyl-prolyl cis-trans isomerase [Cyclobacteriaceae bacterium]|nr:FKBP-type peptidyl-prolyl cis-trans isomerase [Cyclobacteriaceae bacterium]
MIRSLIVIVLITVLFDNCSTDMKKCTQQVPAADIAAVNQTQLAIDVALIDKYLSDRNITPFKDGALRYVVTTPGSGSAPCLESTIAVTYTGKLMTNGNIFDSSANATSFSLSSLILGWKIGLLNVSKGAVVTLYIPSGYAYGPTARTGIPANSNLIFDITLADFSN